MEKGGSAGIEVCAFSYDMIVYTPIHLLVFFINFPCE